MTLDLCSNWNCVSSSDLHDSIKEFDEGESFGALFLSYFQDSNYYLKEVYLSDDSSGKNTVQCTKSGASAALHRNAVLICCSRYSADLGPSVSALMRHSNCH